MATSIEHYQQAEQILRDRHDLAHTYGSYEAVALMATAHATLALAAATALGIGYSATLSDREIRMIRASLTQGRPVPALLIWPMLDELLTLRAALVEAGTLQLQLAGALARIRAEAETALTEGGQ